MLSVRGRKRGKAWGRVKGDIKVRVEGVGCTIILHYTLHKIVEISIFSFRNSINRTLRQVKNFHDSLASASVSAVRGVGIRVGGARLWRDKRKKRAGWLA